MKEYGFDEIREMQQKALERVQNMKLAADRAIADEPAFTPAAKSNTAKGHIQMPVNLPKKQEQVPAESESTPNFLDNIFEEPDKALLLSLLLLFKGDKANEELMTALIYIML